MSMKDGNGKVRKDQTDHYGRVLGKVSINNFIDTDNIEFSQPQGTDKIQADLTAEVIEILNNAIVGDKLVSTNSIRVEHDTENDFYTWLLLRKKYDASGTSFTFLATNMVQLTQAQYDALEDRDIDTLYIIVG